MSSCVHQNCPKTPALIHHSLACKTRLALHTCTRSAAAAKCVAARHLRLCIAFVAFLNVSTSVGLQFGLLLRSQIRHNAEQELHLKKCCQVMHMLALEHAFCAVPVLRTNTSLPFSVYILPSSVNVLHKAALLLHIHCKLPGIVSSVCRHATAASPQQLFRIKNHVFRRDGSSTVDCRMQKSRGLLWGRF